MSEKRKKRRGDRPDGYLVRESDPMHVMMPYLLPNRADNEAVMNESIDLEPVERYLQKKNANDPEFRYTFFHVICAAVGRTIALRPKMNRFYAGYRLYDRNDISLSFVVKKRLADDSAETLAIVKIDPESDVPPIEQVYGQVKKIVYEVRKENKVDGATDAMGILGKLPRPILWYVVHILRRLDFYGKYPKSLREVDPYYTSCFLTNLGSIKMNAQYHHLANWGTNSFFFVVGEKKYEPVCTPDGQITARQTLPIGVTIDERIADGVYFAGSIRLFKEILADPDILDEPIAAERQPAPTPAV